MTSARKIAANRQNARASTGPKSAAGKARSARNAHRHGLSIAIWRDPSLTADAEALAREIAGVGASPELLELARRVSEAQIDIIRVRKARQDSIQPVFSDAVWLDTTFKSIDRYVRRALSRRKFAIRNFDETLRRCENLAEGATPREASAKQPYVESGGTREDEGAAIRGRDSASC
jgi:hypothetical protein